MRKAVRRRAMLASLVLAAIVAALLVVTWIRHDLGNGTRTRGVPASFAGLWTGTVSPSDPANSVTVSIILTTHSSTGGISYGDDLCSGRLLRTSGGTTTISFSQSLTYDPGHICAARGTITLSRPTATTVDFSQAGPAAATGVLHRP